MKNLRLICVILLALTSVASIAFGETRDLFFEDHVADDATQLELESQEPEMQAVVKVNATVELTRNGRVTFVFG